MKTILKRISSVFFWIFVIFVITYIVFTIKQI